MCKCIGGIFKKPDEEPFLTRAESCQLIKDLCQKITDTIEMEGERRYDKYIEYAHIGDVSMYEIETHHFFEKNTGTSLRIVLMRNDSYSSVTMQIDDFSATTEHSVFGESIRNLYAALQKAYERQRLHELGSQIKQILEYNKGE